MRTLIFSLICACTLHANETLPNILWITSEDNSAHWLGCYGNDQAQTPRLDKLASEGVRFRHAYSNAPVCAVARSMILNGTHAVTMGTQHMRSRHPIPSKYRPYVSYLKEKGYYCTNNSKTDYNFEGNDKAIWDQSSNKAHYKNRPEGAPFFAIFNLTTTHESSLFPDKNPAKSKRLKPEEIDVPPYLPDLPEVRSDFGRYHDRMTMMDAQVGKFLDDLEKEGLAENTIVFYYSDHGGATPRGKRYLKQTGVQVPMLVRVPEKFRHLSPFKSGEVSDELVGFVDLAPTVLSLIGLETPEQMQGRAFLGKHRREPVENDVVFLQGDRFDEIYGMRRGLSDGRWKYIRRFSPNKPAAPYSYYQFSMPSWVAWQKAWKEGKLSGRHAAMWESPQVVEELFDMQADPWEVSNLAKDSAHAERLTAMRDRLKREMLVRRDTGVIPEPLWESLSGGGAIAEFVGREGFDFGDPLEKAFVAGDSGEEATARRKQWMGSEDPVTRFWALQGCLSAGLSGAEAVEIGELGLKDPLAFNRIVAAELLCRTDQKSLGHETLLAEIIRPGAGGGAVLYLTNVIAREELFHKVPRDWAEGVVADKKADEYVKRFAHRVLGE